MATCRRRKPYYAPYCRQLPAQAAVAVPPPYHAAACQAHCRRTLAQIPAMPPTYLLRFSKAARRKAAFAIANASRALRIQQVAYRC
ncbi:hypothetical protein NPIL_690341 [Nephila pilipes]|uniref:Uncharacterized protein n=1 Tax=Nephila pilipes TaxID=299642 RepID=A0A8X6Q5G7_NEPPI|nr:hypothetical protein NPIL_690341 [Nephila pilipes]